MPILYEDTFKKTRGSNQFALTKDTEMSVTVTLAAGKGVITLAEAVDATNTLVKLTKAYPGQKIIAHVRITNNGDDDYVWYTVKDKDTGVIIDKPYGTSVYQKSGTLMERLGAELTMPNKNWNWLIEAGHGTP